jgi:hypothetical protein
VDARCPACGKARDVEKQRHLVAAERVWFAREAVRYAPGAPFSPLRDGMRQLALRGGGKWFWACDACLDAGRAVVADVGKQQLGMGTPFAAYVPRPFRCEDCRAESVFGAEEQRHWFEDLGFLIWVHPKQCAPCRAARRRRKRTSRDLAAALADLDVTDPTQLEAIARLYEELGSKKADEYRARARNRRK